MRVGVPKNRKGFGLTKQTNRERESEREVVFVTRLLGLSFLGNNHISSAQIRAKSY